MTVNKILLCAMASAFSVQASAATIVIQNDDGAGEGFSDPTDSATIPAQKGNNPGATLGDMRLKVFEEAAKVWEGILNSNVTITVGAKFDPLTCDEFSGTLGSAGATSSWTSFPGSEAGVAYHVALAESLRGSDLNGASVEIRATFNSDVDADDLCLGDGGFYYGLDGNVPPGMSALFPVVLHELGHGLGFASLSDVSPAGSGDWIGAGANPDAYSRNLLDLETGKAWDSMSSEERKASALNEPDLVWNGAKVAADSDMHLDPAPELEINAPNDIAGIFDAVLGDEPSIVMPVDGVTAGVLDGNTFEDMVFNDPDDPKEVPPEGCTQVAYNPIYNGKIVLFDESINCFGVVQAFFAEFEGAVGVIIVATADNGLPDVSGQIGNQEITIPYIGVEKSVGVALRANLGAANVTIRNSNTTLQGENQGKVKIFAPATFDQGSSVSHWSSTASPDLLMEPNLGVLDFADVDLTAAAFKDIGWSVNIPGGVVELIYKDGFEN